ncbi:hypothetical protein C1701_25920 [Actinoalloteichus sp. AHMU CJ021]|nr:hypothetical protein C1701_25920 [Actinoalloteichus sp. AHMU CJ021]
MDWESGAVALATEHRDWPVVGRPRRAAVSSFGISGTNAHTVLEQPPAPVESAEPRMAPPVLPLVVTARSQEALRAQAARLQHHLDARPRLDPLDVAYSLITTRAQLDHRAVVLADDREDALRGLGALAQGAAAPKVLRGTAGTGNRVVFVFPGQGSQWVGMGLGLLGSSEVYAESFEACAHALAPFVDWSPHAVLRGEAGAPSLDRVDVVQPLLWAVMVSLARVWESCGVRASAVVGHSQGEIAAACVAGALSLEDGARVVALRSRALVGLSGRGGMVSVAAGVSWVEELVGSWGGRVSVAAVNGPRSVVVSGDSDALAELTAHCAEHDVRAKVIPVDYASHSEHVESIREQLSSALAGVAPRAADVAFHSTVTGEPLDTRELDGEYWYRNLREPVRFEQAVRGLVDDGYRAFVEASPHPVLTVGLQETWDDTEHDGAFIAVGSLRRDEGTPQRFAASLAELFVHGVSVDWAGMLAGGRQVDLPTYAFQRRRFWLEVTRPAGDAAGLGLDATGHGLLGAAVPAPSGDGVLLTGRLSVATHPWLADHRVLDRIVVPGTALVEMVVRAGDEVGCSTVEDLTLHVPLILSDDDGVTVQVVVDDDRGVAVYSRVGVDGPWVRHGTGTLVPAVDPVVEGLGGAWPPAGSVPVPTAGLYPALADLGMDYGPVFQGLTAAWRHGEDVLAEVVLPEGSNTVVSGCIRRCWTRLCTR